MAKTESTLATAEHKTQEFADDLGKMLGHARSKAEGWLGQRRQIVKDLVDLRDEVTKLLGQLGHEAAVAGRRGRKAVGAAVAGIKLGPGRPKGPGVKKRRKMSAAARKAIGDAQRKRWAKVKGGDKK